MVRVTRLDGSEIVVNADLIETLEATPDTVITLSTGRRFVVREPVAEVIERVVAYRRRVSGHFAPAGDPACGPAAAGPKEVAPPDAPGGPAGMEAAPQGVGGPAASRVRAPEDGDGS